jgi:hypothetical protein
MFYSLPLHDHSVSQLIFQGPSVCLGYLFNNPRVYLKTAVVSLRPAGWLPYGYIRSPYPRNALPSEVRSGWCTF